MMNKIVLITDSTNDLPNELLKKNNIIKIPLYVNFSDSSYQDGEDITTEELYKYVEAKNELPKTAAISIPTFMELFKKYVDEGYEVIYTGISSSLSRTHENAILAAREINEEKIHIIDSKNLSTGIGLQLLKAARYIREGESIDFIIDKMKKNSDLVKSQFAIETMEYLYKGGRCSGIANFFGTFLKIKPIIVVRDGKMTVGKMPHGKMKVALNALLDMIEADKDNLDLENIIVTHSLAVEYEKYLMEVLKGKYPNANIFSTNAGCVISSHCGKGTIGILYMLK